MSISKEPREQPLNSQCESSSPQPQLSNALFCAHSPNSAHRVPDQVNRSSGLDVNNLDSSCKVSPFKPNTSRSRRLPFPELTPIPLQNEHDHIHNFLSSPTSKNPVFDQSTSPPITPRTSLAKNHVSTVCVPPDIDVPSPPSLSSSDEHNTEQDTTEASTPHRPQVQTPTEKESCAQPSFLLHQNHRSPKTDTCDPPEFSQDSAFFSFSNDQSKFPSDHADVVLPLVEDRASNQTEQDVATQPQTRKRYYTRAFDYVIAEVLKRYSFILPPQDIDIARILRDDLSGNAQALFVRIYGRKQPQWYRVSKLEQAYASEIDVRAGVDELCGERFLVSSIYALKGSPKSTSLLARELLSTLDLSELRTACASIVDGSVLRRLSRNKLLPALRKLLSKSSASRRSKKRLTQTTLSGLRPTDCLARAVLKLAGHSIRVPDFILLALKRMRFLFFLDDGHDSPNVILADTGKVQFPGYKCEPERTVFPSSQALEDYESAIELEKSIDESLENKDWSRAAYFGSIAELEIREFFNCCEGDHGRRLPSQANSPARLELDSLEKCISSRRPALKKRFDRKEQLEQLSHPFLRRYTAQWVLVRCCWHSVHALERLSEYESAVSRLKLLLSTDLMPKRRGKCLTRLTINLFKHLGKLEEPLKIIVSALSASGNHLHLGDRIGLAQRGAAIHTKLFSKSAPGEKQESSAIKRGSALQGVTKLDSSQPKVIMETLKRTDTEISVRKIFGKSLNMQTKEERDRISNIEDPWLRYIEENKNDSQREMLRTNLPIMGKSVFLSRRSACDRVSVEEYCLEWYAEKESLTGVHDEGSSLRFIFTLLLWETALFADIPDVFQTPYQDRPLDLYTEAFYPSRKKMIETRLGEIVCMSPNNIFEETCNRYRQFEGIKAVGCIWTSYSPEDIASVAAGLGGPGLAHCCGLLAKDYTYWGGGLPDLTLWKVDEDSSPKHYNSKLVEVKSARDNLSERQRAWLMELQSCGVECEVCKVVEKVTAANAAEIEKTKPGPKDLKE